MRDDNGHEVLPKPPPGDTRQGGNQNNVLSGHDHGLTKPISLPFGISVAGREPIHSERVDESALVWDRERQIMLVRDSGVLVPWMRHTDGVTSTNSNTDGAGGRETDEDHRED